MIKDEWIDEELQKAGVRFTDATQAPAAKGTPIDAKWKPVPKSVPNLPAQLKGCAKWVATCGGIGMLLLAFQINDLMAIEAAFPCICVCTTLAGYGVGKHTAEGRTGA